MPPSSPIETSKEGNLLKTILWAGLLVGALDITAAFIQTSLYGGSPVRVLNFIASGVFGKEALDGGASFAFYGLVFHFCIAMGWTTLFFLIYPKLKFLSRNKIITGVGYGFFIWLMMNRIVLPLSNVPHFPFRLTSAVIGALILMAAIGLPLSLIANKYYSSRPKK